jgi:hypothetical protein
LYTEQRFDKVISCSLLQVNGDMIKLSRAIKRCNGALVSRVDRFLAFLAFTYNIECRKVAYFIKNIELNIFKDEFDVAI